MAKIAILNTETCAQCDCSGHTVFTGDVNKKLGFQVLRELLNSRIIAAIGTITIAFSKAIDTSKFVEEVRALLPHKKTLVEADRKLYDIEYYDIESLSDFKNAIAANDLERTVRATAPHGTETISVGDIAEGTAVLDSKKMHLDFYGISQKEGYEAENLKRTDMLFKELLALLDKLPADDVSSCKIRVEYSFGGSCGTWVELNDDGQLEISNQDWFSEHDEGLVSAVQDAIGVASGKFGGAVENIEIDISEAEESAEQ
jgi:hypothetical protein